MEATQDIHRIICFGDSITLGVGTAELDKWTIRLAIGLEQWRPGRYSLYSRGFNGATTAVGLERIDPELSYLLPATVLVAFGANDSYVPVHRRTPNVGVKEFENNLTEIARYINERGGRALFIAIHVPSLDRRTTGQPYALGTGQTYAEAYAPYRDAVEQVASGLKLASVDITSEVERRGKTVSDLVVGDGVHLSRAGHAIYADILLNILKNEL